MAWNFKRINVYSSVIINGPRTHIHSILRKHNCVLCFLARSPVFAAMFEHNMVESNRNRVVIIDADYRVVLEMVRFMYTGRVQNLESIAYGLLAAADMVCKPSISYVYLLKFTIIITHNYLLYILTWTLLFVLQYAINGLKGMCEEILRNSMTAQNAADLLILADLHNAHQLLVKSVWYIHTWVISRCSHQNNISGRAFVLLVANQES